MNITTRLDISTSDINEFKTKLTQYVDAVKLDSGLSKATALEELIKLHRYQINTAFRLGLNESNRKESKD